MLPYFCRNSISSRCFAIFQGGCCSSHLIHSWNFIEACLGNALRDVVQSSDLCRQERLVPPRSVHSILPQLACCQRRSPFHLLILIEQVPSFWVPTLPSVHCRSPSCCYCQQLSAAPLPSFPISLTSVHGCFFVAVCRHPYMLQWWI